MKNETLLRMACSHYLCDQNDITLIEAYDKLNELIEDDPNMIGQDADEVDIWRELEGALVLDIVNEIDALYDEFVKVQANPENYKV